MRLIAELIILALSTSVSHSLVLRTQNVTDIEPAERMPTLSAEAPHWGVQQLHWREQKLDRAKFDHDDINNVGVDDGPPDTFAWKNVTVPEAMDFAFWAAVCNATQGKKASNASASDDLGGNTTGLLRPLGAPNSSNHSTIVAYNATNASARSGSTNLTVQEVEFWRLFCNSSHGTDDLHYWRILENKRCNAGVDLPDIMALRECAEATLAKAECSHMFDFWDDPAQALPTCRCMAKTATTCQPEVPEAGQGGIYGAVRRQS
mmetsp:Transcript_66710/g.124632  ORF Transcript_66710/g.124632 Transcript_66710/m.124632 type:complete len:262 (+) Transcript_66710:121-906(+)